MASLLPDTVQGKRNHALLEVLVECLILPALVKRGLVGPLEVPQDLLLLDMAVERVLAVVLAVLMAVDALGLPFFKFPQPLGLLCAEVFEPVGVKPRKVGLDFGHEVSL